MSQLRVDSCLSELLSRVRAELPAVGIREDVSAARLTTVGIGGSLKILFEPDSEQDLESLLKLLNSYGLKSRILGAGSNLLVDDSGISDPVIKLGKGFRSVQYLSEEEIRVGAAMPLMTLSRQMASRGLAGLEFAAGIPASIGGAVFMNAGAHGSEVSEVLTRVRGVLPGGKSLELDRKDINFDYRSSNLPQGLVVTSVVFKLSPDKSERVRERMQKNLEYRKATQPLTAPSTGSVFRNPEQSASAGELIEQAGCKGLKIGGAQVSELHANWIVNVGREASSADYLKVLQTMQQRVEEQSGVELKPELVYWSDSKLNSG